ncbi:nuclear basket protein megator isoform X2 [Nomia melanderi]|uniref:nuclear basket protein megator isoform X2 n=1 Tax=Nomia melanderi TaxID=2448451 RepID=UPI00130470A0|nr:nucleoprotein TPR isoform X2 [Nomia melanderi]
MEKTDENEHNALREVLSDEELKRIPEGFVKKLNAFFNEKFEQYITAKAVFQTYKKNFDQTLEKLQKDLTEEKTNFEECKEKLTISEKYTSELQSNLDEAKNEILKLQESVKRLEKDNADLRRHRDTVVDERDTLQLQVERRDTEIERMHTELSSLGTQLQNAVAAKCQALAETEEIRSRDMTLEFKEKRLEQERALIQQQMAGLEEELAKRMSELQSTRAEASARSLLTDTRLSQRDEELRIANEAAAQLRESYASLQRRCNELAQKLEEQRTQEISMHASYREEIGAQTRLADLYKGMADEANAKAEEFTNAVKELQELLEHATDQYGTLETTHNQLQLQHKEELEEKEQKIEELSKELDHANELLKNIKQERLDQAVEQLAPTAAIANRVLRKGLSLTQIYTQLVEVTNELTSEREENERLKSQMDVILRELEEKAPILQQQREDYETAMTNIATLTSRLDELLAENHKLQETTDEANRIAKHHTKENQRLKTELSDLARQVCYLLKEVQESRTGATMHSSEFSNSVDMDNLVSSEIISKKLVTFKDIEELQENNQKLLSIVRTLSSRQEEIERATDEINSGEMKEKLDRYLEQLKDMQTAQERQAKMLEGLLRQRDMYKNMYQQCLKQTNVTEKKEPAETPEEDTKEAEEGKFVPNESPNVAPSDTNTEKELKKQLTECESKLKQVTDEFGTYRKERTAHERMLGEEVERLRKEAEASSDRCCRLKAQLDSSNDRFNLLQANVTSYKSQIKVLEEKCFNYNVTIGKHEQSLMILKDEALSAQTRLSRAEVQLENIRQERQLLRDSESRLLKEREIYQRERQTQALLRADVESIKASLERVQAEGQLRAEQRLDDATRECAALRRRLQEEQDRFRELSTHLERQLTTAQERLAEERNITEQIRAELEQTRQSDSQNTQRIEELNTKLRQAVTHSISKPFNGDENLVKRLKEVEIQLGAAQAESKSLSEQLKAARQQSQQYCDIAESAEAQLRELTAQHNKCKEELETALKAARVELMSLQREQELVKEVAEVSSGRQETDSELREKLADAERKLEELDELKGELEIVKSDLQSASLTAKEAEEKYAREMVLHSADLQTLAKIKEDARVVEQKITALTQERNSAVEALQLERAACQEREKKLQSEMQEMQQRIDDLDSQNAILHTQIQELSDKTAIMHSQQTKMSGRESPDTSLEAMNRSFSGLEDDSKSAEQLLRVMKYLRREKDLAVTKFDVLRAENLRLKSQVEVLEKRLKETEAVLSSEREKSEIDVVTTSKHAELLRKVETLNAITDSNRILREERDSLSGKVVELTAKVAALSEEIGPLRDSTRDLEVKTEALYQENTSLKAEATRWRQRANALVERANKTSPEDWRRLQTERENLSKLLTSERETHAKRAEEMNQLKTEKSKLEEQLLQLQKQVQTQGEQIQKTSDEARKLNQDLTDALADSSSKAKDLVTLKKELGDKEAVLNDIKNKEIQIRKIAKKYKTQFEELAKTVEEEKTRSEESRMAAGTSASEDTSQVSQEREDQLREEGRAELRQANIELTTKVDELSRQMETVQNEAELLKKEIDTMNKSSVEKEERAKQVLKGARTKIMQLTESKKICEKELLDLKAKLETGTSESDTTEHDARLVALKSQMEGRISRLEHEKAEIQAEKETLVQRVTQLQRQLAGVSGVSATTEPPTANIKPMSARAETPLASIRPMSVVVQSRTAAVLPTTASAPVMVAPHQQQQSQQQVVHTTETSSPTSSLPDFQPASTSSSSQTAPSTLRQLVVQPQLSESAESTQREDPESAETLNVQQQQCQQQQQQQQQQQTVALVSPRVEQQQQQQQPAASDQQQTVASSSTQSVSTSQASTGHKRPRTLDSTASGSGIEGMDHSRQEQVLSPKAKRTRQEMTSTASASASEVEYQVPTSSQRDQDEEVEEGCVVVVDCDEGEGGGNHQAQEEEEFDNDPYEEMEEEEEMPYEVEGEVERDNNEVEIIMGEDSTSVEVPRQAQVTVPTNQQQQQSEAISSAGPTGEPATSFTTRSSRGIAPMPRQQQQQHLLLPQQGYEDGGDDSIVPSTPTLFVPRRGDGFGEAVSSPQVPQGRFTFGDSSAPTTASSTPSLSTPSGSAARTIFGSSSSNVAQVVQESMDDSRMDLTQLEDGGTGRSVPTTPLQVSPAADLPPSTSSGPSEEQETLVSVTPASVTGTTVGDASEEPAIPSIRVVGVDDQQHSQTEIITESMTPTEGMSSESEKRTEEAGPLMSGEDDAVDTGEGTEEPGSDIVEDEVEEESREAEACPSSNTRHRRMAAVAAAAAATTPANGTRTATARRSSRSPFRTARGTRPTPIVWENQSGRVRGHAARGANNETGRGRGTRGRRMRSKYPSYARF